MKLKTNGKHNKRKNNEEAIRKRKKSAEDKTFKAIVDVLLTLSLTTKTGLRQLLE